jgi:hypothetical protein
VAFYLHVLVSKLWIFFPPKNAQRYAVLYHLQWLTFSCLQDGYYLHEVSPSLSWCVVSGWILGNGGVGDGALSCYPATSAINDRLQLDGALSACRAERSVRKGKQLSEQAQPSALQIPHSLLSADWWNLNSWLCSVYIKAVRMKPWVACGTKSRITSGGKKNNGACLFFCGKTSY